MTIEEIKADEVIVMTTDLHRLFNAGGCDPMCHCCEKMLPVGSKFKLGTIQEIPEVHTNYPSSLREAIENYDANSTSKEVMLCEACTPLKYKNAVKRGLQQRIEEFKDYPSRQGCFRVNGKIVK